MEHEKQIYRSRIETQLFPKTEQTFHVHLAPILTKQLHIYPEMATIRYDRGVLAHAVKPEPTSFTISTIKSYLPQQW